MTDRIEPALTPQEWHNTYDHPEQCVESEAHDAAAGVGSFASVIALANAALPDDDPRKITREMVRHLRATAEEYDYLTATADALESYLPPE